MSYPISATDSLDLKSFLETTRVHFGLPENLKFAANTTSPSHFNQPQPFLPAHFYFRRKIVTHYRKLIPSLLLATGLGTIFAGPALADMGCGAMGGRGQHQAQHTKYMEQHHKMLHDALKLTPEQEPGWKKLMDSEQPRQAAGAGQPEDWAKLTAPQRAEKMLELSKARQEQMGEHVVALKAFYATLSPEQQKSFEDFHAGPPGGMRGKPGPGAPKVDKATVPEKS